MPALTPELSHCVLHGLQVKQKAKLKFVSALNVKTFPCKFWLCLQNAIACFSVLKLFNKLVWTIHRCLNMRTQMSFQVLTLETERFCKLQWGWQWHGENLKGCGQRNTIRKLLMNINGNKRKDYETVRNRSVNVFWKNDRKWTKYSLSA